MIFVLTIFAFRAALFRTFLNWFREKVSVFHTAVLGLGISRSPVVCHWGTVSRVSVRRVLLVCCCVHGLSVSFM